MGVLLPIMSALGLGGLGAAAAFVPGFGAVLLGIGKGVLGLLKPVGKFLAKLPWYVYAAAALIGIIAFLAISRGQFMDRAHADEARIAEFCQVVREADHNPKLDCGHAEAQVELMGQALANVTNALNDQTKAVDALAKKSAAQQSEARQASKIAEKRAQDAQGVADRLAASSRAGGPSGAACEPSKALTEQWP